MEVFARSCNYDVLNTERIAARLFVGLGGLVWVVLVAGAAIVYPSGSAFADQWGPILVLALAVGALLLGWFYENAAAWLLFGGAIATVVWGVMAGWEPGVWGLMALFLMTPEIVAGLLFLASAQMQRVCEATGAK